MTASSNLIATLVKWCDENSPREPEENAVIRYGLELMVENLIRTLVLLVIGLILGRLFETVVFLLVFTSLRLEIGGKHAPTQLGCTLCMVVVWGAVLLGNNYLTINSVLAFVIYCVSIIIIVKYAPMSVNAFLFTDRQKRMRKFCGILFTSIFFLISYFTLEIRSLIVLSIAFETITLLPVYRMKEVNV